MQESRIQKKSKQIELSNESDIEQGILTGKILERQRDRVSAESKYRIRGRTLDGEEVEIIAKLSPTGKVVIITVYAL